MFLVNFVVGKTIFHPRDSQSHGNAINTQHPIIYSCMHLKKNPIFNENFPFFALSDHFTVRCEVLKSNTIELVISPQTAKVFTCFYDEKSRNDFETYFYAFLARIEHFDHTCWFGKIKESDERNIYELLLKGIHHINNLVEELSKKKNFGKNIWIRGERGKKYEDLKPNEVFFIL